MNLNNFETLVESKICDRGFDYYENDCVLEIEQVEKGEFSATVEGSEEYMVFVKLDKNLNILDHACDCPYDWGDVCKHEVAVMYYLKDAELYEQPLEDGTFYQLKTNLAQLNKKELMEIILNLSKRNHTVKREIMLALGD